jgi:HK97 family phage prohead protease
MKKTKKPDFSKLFTKAQIVDKDANGQTFTAVASTSTVDRHGEVVSPEGWDLENFKKNPVLLWSHDHTIPAIGKATKIWVEGIGSAAKLMFSGVFQTVTEEGKAAAQLVAEGILNSFSVGFIPSEMVGNTYTEQELLEISLVNVPANPDAMMLAYKNLKESGFSEKTAKYVTQQLAGVGNVRKDLFTAERGALQDELDAEAMWEAKCENMEDVWDIMFALCDVYYDEGTAVEEFPALITEMITILQTVADGTYVDPEDAEDVVEDAIKPDEVIDNPAQKPKTVDNKAKVPTPTAPQAPSDKIRARQSVTKAIAKASDQLLAGEKKGMPKEERVDLVKIIKRGAEVLSKSNKGDMKNG